MNMIKDKKYIGLKVIKIFLELFERTSKYAANSIKQGQAAHMCWIA
jgi:hypothetical protein